MRQIPAKSVGPSMSRELGIVAGVQAAPGSVKHSGTQ